MESVFGDAAAPHAKSVSAGDHPVGLKCGKMTRSDSACRDWANSEAASPEEVFAVAYGFAMRQLKYDDTDKVLARALIRACIARLT
jgi:hypothetical protein